MNHHGLEWSLWETRNSMMVKEVQDEGNMEKMVSKR